MGILDDIGNQLGIPHCKDEDILSHRQRVLLSACSAWALTMLHRNGGKISIEALKATIQSKCRAFQQIESSLLTVNGTRLAEYVYDALRDNGALLHTAYWLRPSPHSLIGSDHIAFVRGMLPEETVSFSGLAPYVQQPAENTAFFEAFDLPEFSVDALWQLLWKRSATVSPTIEIDEYLNQINGGWNLSARNRFPVGIGRTLLPGGGREYYLVQGQEIRRIPDGLKGMAYHNYLSALLVNKNKSGTIPAYHRNNLVHISIPYLPEAEIRFLRYVGWPEGVDILSEKSRFCISEPVWPFVRQRLVQLMLTVEDKQ